MANRSWRNELNNRNYAYSSGYGNQMNYQNVYSERRGYGGGNRGGGAYRDDNKRGKRDFHNRYEPSATAAVGIPKKNIHDNNQSAARRNFNTVTTTATPITAVINKKPMSKYSVKPPKVVYDLKEGSISILRSRYLRLYIPSDFFHSDFRWQEVFPLYSPMELGNKSQFQLFHRDVEPPLSPFDSELAEPADANYIYSAKVMLLSSPAMGELIKTVCDGDSSDATDNINQYKSLNKTLHFLVGSKGKNEPMAIGGPWSASLDGPNPDEDPKVLINTAIRTCKQLTGIDLSPCKDWYRFIEFHYYRPADRQGTNISTENDENRNESELDFRVETVVLFIPSIWDCMPDVAGGNEGWEELKKKYANALENVINPPIPEPTVEIMDTDEKKDSGDEKKDAVEEKEEESIAIEDVKEDKSDEHANELKDELVATEESKPVEKTETENACEAEKIEIKELSDKDKKRFERLYKMNDSPAIPVHINKTVKNGKFDCQLVSLSSLLEYRSDDQKENTFEVSVFAEQFNEMLLRDAAFKIYKTFLALPNTNTNTPQDTEKVDGEPDAKRKREESTTESVKPTETTPGKEKVPLDSDTLLKFCIFDVDHADYIKEHDMEEILHAIGLDLSRSQARKLISKASNKRGGVHYRELTIDADNNADNIASITADVNDIELSKGNKSKLVLVNNADSTVYLDNKTNTMSKIKAIESKIKNIVGSFNESKLELESIRSHYHTAKDMENTLRAELKDLESKLYIERKNVREANQLQDIYNGLLRMSRDVLERAKSKIDRQFDKDSEKEKQTKVETKISETGGVHVVVNGNE